MAKRGPELSEHILYAAKTVFLEMGFERASMDVIAVRAQTSKRTLYAHFESKEKLYLAIINLVREMSLTKLKSPEEYSEDPAEALVQFCARYQAGLNFVWTVRMCRMIASEAERFPEGAALYFEVLFTLPEQRLATYLQTHVNLSEEASLRGARRLMANLIHPTLPQALFGITPPSPDPETAAMIDLTPIRQTIDEFLKNQN